MQIGRGKWAQILEAGKQTFQGRTQVDLKVTGLSCSRVNTQADNDTHKPAGQPIKQLRDRLPAHRISGAIW